MKKDIFQKIKEDLEKQVRVEAFEEYKNERYGFIQSYLTA